ERERYSGSDIRGAPQYSGHVFLIATAGIVCRDGRYRARGINESARCGRRDWRAASSAAQCRATRNNTGRELELSFGRLLSSRHGHSTDKGRNMIGEIIVVGDLKLREHAPLDEYARLGERMYGIVSRLPGFLSVKSFKAEDGEELTLFRFASEEALEAWRTHPDHVETMRRGHTEFYSGVYLQICKVTREAGPIEHA